MNILAIETATKACSASIYKNGEMFTVFELAPQKHANLILSMVQTVLQQAGLQGEELNAIALSEGPGAFTGVRIAAGVVQGLAFGWDKPVISVSTLEALIWQAYEQTGLTAWIGCLDARMKEVYCQVGYVKEGVMVAEPARLVSLTEAEFILQGKNAIGDILQEYPDLVKNSIEWLEAYPTAEAIAKIAAQRMSQAVLLTDKIPVPVYLRNNIAEKKKS